MRCAACRVLAAVLVATLPAIAPAAAPLAGATQIAAGANHGCALVAGSVLCWGDNAYGQMGNGTRDRALGATPVGGLPTPIAALSRGHSALHQCAIGPGGGVWCWGHNGVGQLGDGTFTASLVPLQVPGLASVVALAQGGDHTCALTAAGGLKCWGNGTLGQLGHGVLEVSKVPVDVAGLTSGVAEVVSGYRHTCARTTGGAVKCWGFNQFGQIGNGTVNVVATTPADVTGLGSSATAIGAGYQHTCAATAAGAFCWGWNGGGQGGNGTNVDSAVPVAVTGLTGVAQFALGQFHSCARTAAGAAWCWGAGLFGLLGDDQMKDSKVPVAVVGLGSGVAELAAGDMTNCARLSDGSVRCWGENTEGQVGLGKDSRSAVPVTVPVPLATGIGAGGDHTCMTSSSAWCWGKNWDGQIGVPNATRLVLAPTFVAGLPGAPVDVRGGWAYSCAIVAGGGVWCWGANDTGQLGNGSTTYTSVPGPVSGLDSGVTQIAPGLHHTCALKAGGVKCWGGGGYGQLGQGEFTGSLVPVDVVGLGAGVVALVAGSDYSCALTAAGAVKCWGTNADGQLGNGGSGRSNVPVDVTGLGSGVTALAAGDGHACAVGPGGGVWCWGYNGNGQLGNGSTALSRVPVAVSGLTGATAVAAGGVHACAVVAGAVRCWGWRYYGQIGDGTFAPTSQLVPAAVVALAPSAVSSISAGTYHTCVRNDAGGVQCWGSNLFGQLGDGGANSYPSPVPVVLDDRCATFTDVAAAGAFCPNVQWLRNRGVTLGCLPGQYCPTATVSRLAMAAFMNRLGTALAPDALMQEGWPGALDPDARPRLCTTTGIAELGFGRRAAIDAIVSATASQEAGFGVEVLASVDGGNTWRTVSGATQRVLVPAGAWTGVRVQATVDLDVGRGARFALALDRAGFAPGAWLDDTECRLRVRLDNRNGATVPH